MPGPREARLDARLDWAWRNIQDAQDQIVTFASQGGVYNVVPEENADLTRKEWRAQFRASMPDGLEFLVGDCIHDLRASLDNIVWQLALCYSTTPPKMLEFPVCSSSSNFEKRALPLLTEVKLPQGAVDLIESVQPYHRTNSSHTLRLLHRSWNTDKHRGTILVNTFNVFGIFERGVTGRSDEAFDVWWTDKPFEDSMVVAGATCAPGQAAQIQAKLSQAIALDEVGPLRDRVLPPQLIQYHYFVRNEVLNPLRPFFR